MKHYLLLITLLFTTALSAETIKTDDGDLTIHAISHASMVLTLGDTVVVVDPVGDAEQYRQYGDIDVIYVTHIHGDHFNKDTLQALGTKDTILVCPASVHKKNGKPEGVVLMENGESRTIAGIPTEAIPAYNMKKERLGFHPKGRDNGYILKLGGKRIYISGDTEDIPEMRALKNIDAAFLCMNLPYTMSVEKAAEAVKAFKPAIVYPYHYRNGDKTLSDLHDFKKRLKALPAVEVRLLPWYPE